MKRSLLTLVATLALGLSGCVNIVKVDGEQVVNGRLAVRLPSAWNKVAQPGVAQPFDLWTQEGAVVDQLRIWSAVAANAPLVTPPPANREGQAVRVPTWTPGMRLDQKAGLIEQVYAIDGSTVTVDKVEPAQVGGQSGVRLEFGVVRRADNLQLRGVAWAVEQKGQLFVVAYTAPRLGFFGRHAPQVQELVRSVNFRG